MTFFFVPQAATTFAAPADTAERLLPKVGVAMGVRLEADRTAGRQVLLVRVDKMPRERLLKLVAETTGGAWETIKGGYRLVLGPSQRAALWREETARREAAIRSALTDPKVRWSGRDDLDFASLRSLASLVGVSALAGLRPAQRTVWAIPNTENESPLPAAAMRIGNSVVSSRHRRIDDYERRGAELSAPVLSSLNKDAARVTFAARRGQTADEVGVAYEIRAADGSPIESSSGARIPVPPPPADAALIGRMPAQAQPFPKSVVDGAAVAVDRAKVSPAGYPRYAHPETIDPLALAVGPALEETGTALRAGVVACLPDQAFGKEFYDAVGSGLSKDWPRALGRCGMDARLQDGTLVIRLANRASGVELRADRALLRRRIADVERDGHLNYRYSEPYGLEYAYLNALPTDLYHDLYRWEWPWETPLAWNSLTPTQRSRALAGGLPLREVPECARLLTSVREAPSLLEDDEAIQSLPPRTAFLTAASKNGLLRARIEETPMAQFVPNNRAFPQIWGFHELAKLLIEAPNAEGYRAATSGYYPAVSQNVALRIEFSSQGQPAAFSMSTFELNFRTSDVRSTYPNLFPALQQAVRQAGGQ